MSHSDPNTPHSPHSEPQRNSVPPVYAYTISWKWFLSGFIGFLVFAGLVVGVYFLQTANMSAKILDVVQRMVEESDKARSESKIAADTKKKESLLRQSIKLRADAANLLNDYRQANPGDTGSAAPEKLFEILESLYKDYGEGSTPQGRERGEQLYNLALQLVNTVGDAESIKYRTRVLELAWDRRTFSDIINRGLALLTAAQAISGAENGQYDAIRYIAMAVFDNLPAEPYRPALNKLPAESFPVTLDELLEKLNTAKPEDIEIARRYAEFLVSVDKTNFGASASEKLQEQKPAERLTLAKNRIDDMVQRNQNDPKAYLARYHFSSQFMPPQELPEQLEPDLDMVLKLDPNNRDGLLLSGIYSNIRRNDALKNNQEDAVLNWQTKAEDFFRRAIAANPADPFVYQYLGDFLMFEVQKPAEAIEIWNQGLAHSNHRNDEELIGRLVMFLLDQRSGDAVDEVREKLEHLTRTIADMQYTRQSDIRRAAEMHELLTARLYFTESRIAASKIEAAQQANRTEEVRRLYSVVQQKQGDAMQKYDHQLRDFGKNREDYVYVMEKNSVYRMLVPSSLLQAGDIKLAWNQWDAAAAYYDKACRFQAVKQRALIGLSTAYQNGRQLDQAVDALQKASANDPENLDIRYRYALTLFRSEVGSNNPDPAALDTVQKELQTIESRRSELPNPWELDIRLIHLAYTKATLSNSADAIVNAMNDAISQFKALERGTFPPDTEGKVRNYIDDPDFVAELAGIYSNLAARSDFDRLLPRLREFPEGEYAYYNARINDYLRRDDKENAAAVIGEAVESKLLSNVRKERFVSMLQTIQGTAADSQSPLEKLYSQLKTSFDEFPETLNPPVFFLLAKMSLDRGEQDKTKQVLERLRKIEGPEGRFWQYIDVRMMLEEKDPDYEQMRQKQELIVKIAPDWDEAYALGAMIEEQYMLSHPGDTEARDRLISDCRSATQCGSRLPAIWRRLAQLLEATGRSEEAKEIVRTAALRGVSTQTPMGQLPSPYNRMYTQIQEAIAANDAVGADGIAQQCIALAEKRGDRPELIFSLNLLLGKVFYDATMYDSAVRHLSETAKRGGTDVYPLALCAAKMGDVDGAYSMLLKEINLSPHAASLLLPSVLVMLATVQPTEAIYEQIDQMMENIERGERITFKGTAGGSEEGNIVQLSSDLVPSRKIQSLMLRFPEKTDKLSTSSIQIFAPSDVPPNDPPPSDSSPDDSSANSSEAAPPEPAEQQ